MTIERWFGAALGVVLSAVVGCNREPSPTAEPSVQPTRSPPSAAAPGAAQAADNESPEPTVAASSRFSETGFDLELAAKAGYQAGKAGEAEIVLVAKPPFH